MGRGSVVSEKGLATFRGIGKHLISHQINVGTRVPSSDKTSNLNPTASTMKPKPQTLNQVKLGTHVLSDEKVAVKTFEKSKLTESHARKRVAREIRILKALDHPNIIKLYEVGCL